MDNLEYAEGMFRTIATASHYVVSWHLDKSDDLFTGLALDTKGRLFSRQTRLDVPKLAKGKKDEEEIAS